MDLGFLYLLLFAHFVNILTMVLATSIPTTPNNCDLHQKAPMIKSTTPTWKVSATRFTHQDSEFEYSVHSPGTRFGRELGTVFPALSTKQLKEILVVPVIQRCEHDMVGITQQVNHERDDKLEKVSCSRLKGRDGSLENHSTYFYTQFVTWGKLVVERLKGLGMWADIMDPASGFPVSQHKMGGTKGLLSHFVSFICIDVDLLRGWTNSLSRRTRNTDVDTVRRPECRMLPYIVTPNLEKQDLPFHHVYHCTGRYPRQGYQRNSSID